MPHETLHSFSGGSLENIDEQRIENAHISGSQEGQVRSVDFVRLPQAHIDNGDDEKEKEVFGIDQTDSWIDGEKGCQDGEGTINNHSPKKGREADFYLLF